MTMIIYIVLFVLLLTLTFMSFKKFSNNIFCFGTPILGFVIMVLSYLKFDIDKKLLIIFGIAAVAGLILWIVIAYYRRAEQNSTNRGNAFVGGITSRLAGVFDNDGTNNLVQGLKQKADSRLQLSAEEPEIAVGGKFFNAVYFIAVLVLTIISAIRNR